MPLRVGGMVTVGSPVVGGGRRETASVGRMVVGGRRETGSVGMTVVGTDGVGGEGPSPVDAVGAGVIRGTAAVGASVSPNVSLHTD